MLRTLPTTSHHIAICEGNFLRLSRLLNKFSQEKYAFETVNPNSSHLDIKFLVLNKTKHTVLLEARQSKVGKNTLNNFRYSIINANKFKNFVLKKLKKNPLYLLKSKPKLDLKFKV